MPNTGEHTVETHEPNASCLLQFEELKRRLIKLEEDEFKREIWAAVGSLREQIAGLNGRMAGYLFAATSIGGILAFVAQYVLKGH